MKSYFVQYAAGNRIQGLYANPQPQPDGTCLTHPIPLPETHPAVQAFIANPTSLPVASAPAATPLPDTQMPTPFGSGLEQFGDIAISANSTNPPMYSIYSCQIDAALPTDQYRLDVQCEITNPNAFNVGIGTVLLRSTGGPFSLVGTELIARTEENITPGDHHRVFIRNAWDSGIGGTVWYNFLIWPVSSSANGGQNIQVEQGYGKLVVARFR